MNDPVERATRLDVESLLITMREQIGRVAMEKDPRQRALLAFQILGVIDERLNSLRRMER